MQVQRTGIYNIIVVVAAAAVVVAVAVVRGGCCCCCCCVAAGWLDGHGMRIGLIHLIHAKRFAAILKV